MELDPLHLFLKELEHLHLCLNKPEPKLLCMKELEHLHLCLNELELLYLYLKELEPQQLFLKELELLYICLKVLKTADVFPVPVSLAELQEGGQAVSHHLLHLKKVYCTLPRFTAASQGLLQPP